MSLNFCLNFSFSLFHPLFLVFSFLVYFCISLFCLSLCFSLLFSPPCLSPTDCPASRPCLPAASPCPDASTLCPWSDPDVRQGLAGGHGQLPGRRREGTPSRSPLWWPPALLRSSQLKLQSPRPDLSWLESSGHSMAAWPVSLGLQVTISPTTLTPQRAPAWS